MVYVAELFVQIFAAGEVVNVATGNALTVTVCVPVTGPLQPAAEAVIVDVPDHAAV